MAELRKAVGKKQFAQAVGISVKTLNKKLHEKFKNRYDGVRTFYHADQTAIENFLSNQLSGKKK